MLGAIIGDIVGSRFEFWNYRGKDFKLFTDECVATDDSVMTLAVALALMQAEGDMSALPEQAVACMQMLGKAYPYAGYGGMFSWWLDKEDPKPYNSYGNGAAMRVSACGFWGNSLEEVKALSYAVTAVTHNHPEGIKGAEATAVSVFLARQGKSKEEIKRYVCENYYPIDFTLDEIRNTYCFNETCQDTVPQALEAFFESTSFEDAIRCGISIGGDSDTIGAIVGGIAEAYYGIPDEIRLKATSYLDKGQANILQAFYNRLQVKNG